MNDLDHSRFETWQQQQQATPQKRYVLLELFAVFLRAFLDLADKRFGRSPPEEPDPPPAAPARRAPVPARPWTAEDDAVLLRPRLGDAALAAHLGRSVRAIACRRARLRRHKLWGGPRKAPQSPARDKPKAEPGLVQARTELVTVIGLAVAKRREARAKHRAAIGRRIPDFGDRRPPRDERRACLLHLLDLELARRDELERMENTGEAVMPGA